jgi:hypothetical protein
MVHLDTLKVSNFLLKYLTLSGRKMTFNTLRRALALSGAVLATTLGAVFILPGVAQAAPLCTTNAIVSYTNTSAPRVTTVETTWAGDDYAKLRARKTSVGTNEKFQLCWYSSEGYYTLKALANSRYITAETGYSGSWNGVLRASSTTVGTKQQFRITGGAGGSVNFSKIESVANGRYVSCEATWSGDIQGILRARNLSAGTYERFQFPSA